MMKGQSLTFQIPTDFATLQNAIDGLSPTVNNDVITLNIATGHQPASGLVISNGDYSQFRITSTDAEVTVSNSFPAAGIFLDATNASCPVFEILLNMNSRGDRGINLIQSSIKIESGCGVKNTLNTPDTSAGIYAASCSEVVAPSSVFTGNGRNIHITTASRANFAGSDLSNAYNIGAYISRGSILNASNTDFFGAISGTNSVGLFVLRSFVSAISGCDFSDCRIGCIGVENSMVSVPNSAALNCTFRGYRSESSIIDATNSDATGCPTGYEVVTNGVIKRNGSTGTNSLVFANQLENEGIIFDDSQTSRWMALGAGLPVITEDFDAITWTGVYSNNTTIAVGAPTADFGWNIWHITNTTTRASQLAMRDALYRRYKTGGVWSAWVSV
jgi:hypothetical protein